MIYALENRGRSLADEQPRNAPLRSSQTLFSRQDTRQDHSGAESPTWTQRKLAVFAARTSGCPKFGMPGVKPQQAR